MTDIASPVGTARGSAARIAVSRSLHGEQLAVATVAISICALPFVVPTGPGNLAPADAFIFVAEFAALLWFRTARRRLRFPYALPVAIFMLGGLLGALVGPVPGQGILAIAQDILLLVWCWTVVNVARSAANLRTILATWAYASIGWTILLFIGLATGNKTLTGQIERQGSRVQIALDDPSYAANYFFISIMIIWAIKCPKHRSARYAAIAALTVSLVLTGSISGMLSLVVGTAVAMVLGVYRRNGLIPAITCAVFALLAGGIGVSRVSLGGIQSWADSSQYAFVRDGLGRSQSEGDYRGLLFHESIGLYRQGGLLGQGPVSTKVRLENEGAAYVKESHDDYLAALLERGAIGFAGLLLFFGGVMYRTASFTRAKLAGGLDRVVVSPNALVGAIAGTMLTSAAYELLHVRHVWTLFAIVAAVYVWGVRRE